MEYNFCYTVIYLISFLFCAGDKKDEDLKEAEINNGWILNSFPLIFCGFMKNDFSQSHTDFSPFPYVCLFGKIFKYDSLYFM